LMSLEHEHREPPEVVFLDERAPRELPDVVGAGFAERVVLVDDGLPAVEPRVAGDLLARGHHGDVGGLVDVVGLVGLNRPDRLNTVDHQKTVAVWFFTRTTAKVTEVTPPVVTVAART